MNKYDYKRAITNDVKDWIVNDTDLIEEGYMDGRDDDIYNWIYDEYLMKIQLLVMAHIIMVQRSFAPNV